MKTLCLIILLVGSSSFAAIPQVTVEELLTLPEANRKLIANMQPKSFYNKVVGVAFDNQKPMSIRWKALMLASDLGKKSAIADLMKASRSNDWFMRNASLVALKDQDAELSYHVAKKLVQDKALVVRSAAVDVIAGSKDPAARSLLWEELNQKYNFKNKSSLWIRSQIVEVLSDHPEVHEKNKFVSLLSDTDNKLHQSAVQALEKVTGKVLGDKKTPMDKKVALWKKEIL
ncbi:MAG: hypothetical protein AABY64_06075 [Bdellovibrionota bacterium]